LRLHSFPTRRSSDLIESFEGDEALDAALIAAAQKVEHYEIASYGCLVTYAKLMGHVEAEKLLSATLAEEKETDDLLTEIAMEERSEEHTSELQSREN